jgi:hypothetical protein
MKTIPFIPLTLVTEVPPTRGKSQRFEVDPDVVYPILLDAIEAGVLPSEFYEMQENGRPQEEMTAAGKKYLEQLVQCRRCPQAIADARQPLDPSKDPERADRAFVLECARLWFTHELQRALIKAGKPADFELHFKLPREKCPDCNGEGTVPGGQISGPAECPTCKGRRDVKVSNRWAL